MNKDWLNSGKDCLVENIKLMLYKQQDDIFDILEFENESIYQDPLFFAYFNNKQKSISMSNAIIYGHTSSDLRPEEIHMVSDEFGRIYIPNVGWLTTGKPNYTYSILKSGSSEIPIRLTDSQVPCEFSFESPTFIEGTKIELLKYSIPLLKQFFYDEYFNRINVEVENITKKCIEYITCAFNLIKLHVPEHYAYIEAVTKSVLVFNVDTKLRNSFATLNAQGIAFFNAYQDEYNEVFFIDDIAHQTGHIIFNALIYDASNFLKIDVNKVVEEIKDPSGVLLETRDIHVVFHALYTYYTTLLCLDAIYDAQVLNFEKEHELLGRIRFYSIKCSLDLALVDSFSGDFFTESGMVIFSMIKSKYEYIVNKYHNKTKYLKMHNQPYNFTVSKFLESNPLH